MHFCNQVLQWSIWHFHKRCVPWLSVKKHHHRNVFKSKPNRKYFVRGCRDAAIFLQPMQKWWKSRAYLNKGPSKKTGDWQWQFIRINAQSFDLKFRFWSRSFLRPLPTMLTTTSASIFIWLFFDGLFLTRQCRRSPLENPKAIATILVEVAMNMRNILRGQPKNGNMAIQNTFRSLDMKCCQYGSWSASFLLRSMDGGLSHPAQNN